MQKMKLYVQDINKQNLYGVLLLWRYYLANKRSILLFLTVGTISAIVNFGSFSLLWNVCGINYKLAVSIAYFLSVVVHFFANRRITFASHNIHFLRQMPRYLTMIFINYLITLMVTRFTVEVLLLSPYIGIVLSIGVTINTSYFMLRYWVFPKVVKKAESIGG
jgi:putative flippase GtrA